MSRIISLYSTEYLTNMNFISSVTGAALQAANYNYIYSLTLIKVNFEIYIADQKATTCI